MCRQAEAERRTFSTRIRLVNNADSLLAVPVATMRVFAFTTLNTCDMLIVRPDTTMADILGASFVLGVTEERSHVALA